MSNIKKLPKSIKIVLIVSFSLVGLRLLIKGIDYIYCNTFADCDYDRPTLSPEEKAIKLSMQYELAKEDIDAARYDIALKRLEYILALNPEFPGINEKIAEIEKLQKSTITP